MMFSLAFPKHAERTREQYDPIISQKIKSNPYKFIEPLNRPKGAEQLYKLRIGEYRAIMAIRNNEMVILVVDIGHRKIIYRKYQ